MKFRLLRQFSTKQRRSSVGKPLCDNQNVKSEFLIDDVHSA
jgi:hypothetical protein